MKKKFTIISSIFLCICLLFTMIPTSAFASSAEGSNVAPTSEQTDSSNENTTPPSEGGGGTGDVTTGGDSTGGDTTGGENTGGDITGGDSTGGENTGGDTTGGDSTGGNTPTPDPEPTPDPKPEPKPEPLKIKGDMYKTRYTYLSWNSVDSKASYYVYRSTKAKSGFKKIGTVSQKTGTVKFYDKKAKLTLGKTYYYKVKKVVNKKTVETSNTVSIKIRLLPVKNVKASVNSKNEAKITWKKSSGATSYQIYRSTSKTGTYKKIATTSKTSYTNKKLSSGKAYYYKIYANKKGVSAKSKSSAVVAVYTKTAKPKVTTKYVNDQVKLSWKKVSGASTYQIYKKNSNGTFVKIAETKSLSHVDADVTVNTGYRYKVRGVYKKDDKTINGNYSSEASVYTGKIDPNQKMIALTFDDGPGPYTDEIVDCLNKNGARATFFVVGNRVNTYKSQLAYAFNSGNEIANHTYSHPTLTKLSTSKIKSQISKTDNVVEKITGQKPTIIRAPGGATNSTVRKAAGKPFIYWSIDTLDWKHKNATKTVNHVMNNVKDGDIILMHDIHKPTMKAALTLIPKLKKAGYQLVTVSELAQYRGYDLKNGTTYYTFK